MATEEFHKPSLNQIDYAIFIASLLLSMAVGLYYGVFKKKANTMDEYMFGGRKLQTIPVALSCMASVVSTVALLVFPREYYYYGAQIFFIYPSAIIAGLVAFLWIMPIFYEIKVTTVFEYLEKRYNQETRSLSAFMYCTMKIFHMLVVLHSAGSAITQVFPLSYTIFTPSACLLCTLYTTMGGIRGVVWVDAVQLFVILFAAFVFIIYGIYEVGGVANVFKINNDNGRFDIDIFDMNPFVRYSPISTSLMELIQFVTMIGLNQGLMQRYLSLPSFKKAKIAAISSFSGIIFLSLTSCFLGMIIYASYHDCDPVFSKQFNDSNHIVTYYILDKGKHLPGLSGLFLASILAAAFSTISTLLNAITAVIYEDLLKPVLPFELRASQTQILLKSLVGILGVFTSFTVLALNDSGSIYQMYRTMVAMVIGILVHTFLFGMLWRKASSKGAIIGGLAGVVVTIWLSLGIQSAVNSGKIKYNTKLVSIEGCSENITSNLNLNVTTMGYRGTVPVTFSEDLQYPYRISYQYVSVIGVVISFIVGLVVNLIAPNKNPVDERLLIAPLRTKNGQRNRSEGMATEQEMIRLNPTS